MIPTPSQKEPARFVPGSTSGIYAQWFQGPGMGQTAGAVERGGPAGDSWMSVDVQASQKKRNMLWVDISE